MFDSMAKIGFGNAVVAGGAMYFHHTALSYYEIVDPSSRNTNTPHVFMGPRLWL